MNKITILFKLDNKDLSASRGFSLIELVIAIVVLGFALASLVKMFTDLSVVSVQPEYRNTQMMLAKELMEEIQSKRFDELTMKDGNGNWSGTLGVETGEVKIHYP